MNISEEEVVDCWSDSPLILKKLRDLLPFGQVQSNSQFQDFINQDLQQVAEAAQEQLLYLHLAKTTTVHNLPAKSLLLWSNDDHFWFHHMALRRGLLVTQILQGEQICWLEHF